MADPDLELRGRPGPSPRSVTALFKLFVFKKSNACYLSILVRILVLYRRKLTCLLSLVFACICISKSLLIRILVLLLQKSLEGPSPSKSKQECWKNLDSSQETWKKNLIVFLSLIAFCCDRHVNDGSDLPGEGTGLDEKINLQEKRIRDRLLPQRLLTYISTE